MLVQLFGDSLRLCRELAHQKRTKNINGGLHEVFAGEGATDPDHASVGVNRNQCMRNIIGLQFLRPTALWGSAAKASGSYVSDSHGRPYSRLLLVLRLVLCDGSERVGTLSHEAAVADEVGARDVRGIFREQPHDRG